MKLVLLKSVDNLGHSGDVVTVKNGYGSNYLIPQGMAVLATKDILLNISRIQEKIRQQAAKEYQETSALEEALSNISLEIQVNTGNKNRIHGTITPAMVAEKLLEKGYDIHRKMITLDEKISVIGDYTAEINLTNQSKIRIPFSVISK